MTHDAIDIVDPTDPRVADYVGLTDAALRRRFESPDAGAASPHGRFIAEGMLALEALVRSPYPIRSVLVAEPQLIRVQALLDDTSDVPLYVASPEVLEAVVGFRIHRGVVASADRLPMPDPIELVRSFDTDRSRRRRIAVLEGLNDHENLGVLFRNAAAFGLDAVLLDPRCADPLYRRAVRVSLGHVLHVPFARFDAGAWPDRAVGDLRQLGYEVVALMPDATAPALEAIRATVDRLAWLLGAEGPGLTTAAQEEADRRVRIAMEPGVDSLNVATAAAVAFHWARPRSGGGPADSDQANK